MTAQDYCERVERHYRRHQRLLPAMPIRDDNTKLISLANSGFSLIFEPSIQPNYQYLAREVVHEKIGRLSKQLENDGMMLIIRSAWRSFEHQKLLWEERIDLLKKKYPDREVEKIEKLVSYFVAPPNRSMHSTGGAIDALLYDMEKDCVMDFGTNDGLHIRLNDKCYPYHPHITPEAKRNRKILIELFEKENFVVDLKEYWHFDYGNASWALEKKKAHAIYGIVSA